MVISFASNFILAEEEHFTFYFLAVRQITFHTTPVSGQQTYLFDLFIRYTKRRHCKCHNTVHGFRTIIDKQFTCEICILRTISSLFVLHWVSRTTERKVNKWRVVGWVGGWSWSWDRRHHGSITGMKCVHIQVCSFTKEYSNGFTLVPDSFKKK